MKRHALTQSLPISWLALQKRQSESNFPINFVIGHCTCRLVIHRGVLTEVNTAVDVKSTQYTIGLVCIYFLALLACINRSHEIEIRPFSVRRPSSTRPSSVFRHPCTYLTQIERKFQNSTPPTNYNQKFSNFSLFFLPMILARTTFIWDFFEAGVSNFYYFVSKISNCTLQLENERPQRKRSEICYSRRETNKRPRCFHTLLELQTQYTRML